MPVRVLALGVEPTEVTTDKAPAYPRVLDEHVSAALHVVAQYANSPIEADHCRLKAWLPADAQPEMLPVGPDLAAGQPFVQNLQRGQYEIATDEPPHDRLRLAFDAPAASI